MWDSIGDDFCSLASEVFASGRLSEFLNQGLIKLIPKNAARDTIGGWRPMHNRDISDASKPHIYIYIIRVNSTNLNGS
uniref:Uncharacterized protein n=1 Tax=Picea glauca TaxID=3330 RepID=A0A101M2Z6_PICGL|nr:hypothetical protein ABT39_MTgene3225 [Picea glauca]